MAINSSTSSDRSALSSEPKDYSETWKLLAQSDPATVRQIYHDGHQMARRYIRFYGSRITDIRDEVLEALHTAFLRFMYYCEDAQFEFNKPPLAVLHGIIKIVVFERRREKLSRRVVHLEDFPGLHPQDDKEHSLAEKLQADTLERCVLEALEYDLQPKCRNLIDLKYFDGLPYRSIAESLRQTIDYVRRHLFKCRKFLVQAAQQRLQKQALNA